MKTKNIFKNWNTFLSEGRYKKVTSEKTEQQVLREIEFEELDIIQPILDKMKGEVLAFNDLFKGKNRLILPFESVDPESDIGSFNIFIQGLKKFGWEVDYKKGTLSRDKPVTDAEELTSIVMAMSRRGEFKKPVKETLKIGKFLSLYRTHVIAFSKIVDWEDKDWSHWNSLIDKNKDIAISRMKKKFGANLTAPLVTGQLFKFPPTRTPKEYLNTLVNLIEKKLSLWQTNAELIRQGGAKTDFYSIVITRHPIDVLRMSDFEDIESCHSPPSRGGESQYYKCAVAEAYGHGAVAFAIVTKDLVEMFGEEDISKIEDSEDFQDEEIFLDDARGVVGIEPINRVRLRQIRYYESLADARKAAEEKGGEPGTGNPTAGGVELAIPERRVYGLGHRFGKVQGFQEAVLEWAKQAQKEAIENIPVDIGGEVRGRMFVKFGGTYQDAPGVETTFKDLTGLDINGVFLRNSSTEDQIDYTNSQFAAFQEALDNYASRLEFFKIEIDWDEGLQVTELSLNFEWHSVEWNSLPRGDTSWILDEIRDYGERFAIFHSGRRSHAPDIRFINENSMIKVSLPVSWVELTIAYDNEEAMYDPYAFENLLADLDREENNTVRGIYEILEQIFKREGYLKGGEMMLLGMEVEGGSLDPYEWSLDTVGDYPEFETVSATTTVYEVDTGEVGGDMLRKIVSSRDFEIEIKKAILAKPREIADSNNFISFKVQPYDITNGLDDNSFDLKMTAAVYDSDPAENIEIFKALIEEMDDEDLLKKIVTDTYFKVRRSISSGKQISEQKLIRNWKMFLKG